MKKNYIKRLLVFFTVIIIFSLVYIPLFNDLKFGLDLKGGFEVLYQVKRSDGKRSTPFWLWSTDKTSGRPRKKKKRK